MNRIAPKDFYIAIFIAGAVLVAGIGCILLRPDLFQNDEELILGEAGNLLYRAEQIFHGKVFYKEIASQYGPTSTYLYAGLAYLIGNHGISMAIHNTIFPAIGLVFLFLTIRFVAPLRTSLLFFATIAIWTFVYPFTPFGVSAYGGGEYMPVEKLFVATIAFLLVGGSTARSSGAIGLLLGLMQTVKFGLAFYLGLAIAVLELMAWLRDRSTESFGRLVWRGFSLALAFCLVQASYFLVLLVTLPPEIAWEAVFPSWILEGYPSAESWMTFDKLVAGTPLVYVTQRIVILSAFLLGLIGVACIIVETVFGVRFLQSFHRRHVVMHAPFLACLLGFGTFLAHEHLVFVYSWLVLFGAVPIYSVINSWLRTLAIAIPIPAFCLIAKVFLINPVCETTIACEDHKYPRLYSPRGGTSALFDEFYDRSSTASSPHPLYLFVNDSAGGGFHYYFQPWYPLRTYLADRPYIRPHDVPAFVQAGETIAGLLVTRKRLGERSFEELVRHAFPKPVADTLARRKPIRSEALNEHIWLFAFEEARTVSP